MKRLYFPLITALFISLFSACEVIKIAPADVSAERFVKFFGGTSNDYGQQIVQTSDGGFLMFGTISLPQTFSEDNEQFYLVKTDAQGNLIWDFEFGTDENEEARKMVVKNDGTALLLAEVFDPTFFTQRITIGEVSIGSKPSQGRVFQADEFKFESSVANDMLVDDNGKIWIFGSFTNDYINHDIALWDISLIDDSIQFNQNLLEGNNDLSEEESAIAFVQRPGGGFILLANIDFNLRIMLVDPDGTIANSRSFEGEGVNGLLGADMKLDGQGNIYICTTRTSDAENRIWVHKLNADLSNNWPSAQLLGPEGTNAYGSKLNISAEGNIYIAGYALVEDPGSEFGSQAQILLTATGPEGSVLPAMANGGYNLFGDRGDDIANDVLPVIKDGQTTGIAVLGSIAFGPTYKLALIHTDESGALE